MFLWALQWMLLNAFPLSCLPPSKRRGKCLSARLAERLSAPKCGCCHPHEGTRACSAPSALGVCQEQPLRRLMLKYISYYGLRVLWPFVKEREFCQGNILQFGDAVRWKIEELFFLMCFCKIPQTTFSSALFPVHSRNWKEFTQEETTLLLSDSYQDSFLCKRNSPVAIINQIIISLSHLSACGWCCSKGEMVISQKWM